MLAVIILINFIKITIYGYGTWALVLLNLSE